jgi:hypothetical protein
MDNEIKIKLEALLQSPSGARKVAYIALEPFKQDAVKTAAELRETIPAESLPAVVGNLLAMYVTDFPFVEIVDEAMEKFRKEEMNRRAMVIENLFSEELRLYKEECQEQMKSWFKKKI